jgi:hypothetical protein
MVPTIHRICYMDSQDLAGPNFHPPVVTFSIFRYNWCCRGGGQARSTIGATACNVCLRQSSPIHTLPQISPSLLSTLCTYGRALFFPPKLHKLTLVAPSNMRDDLHSYLHPLLLQLFQILNVCLNRVFEEFILFIFGQLIESLQG